MLLKYEVGAYVMSATATGVPIFEVLAYVTSPYATGVKDPQ